MCKKFPHYLRPICYNLTQTTHTCGAHTVLGSVVLLYIYTLVQSLFTLGLCTQLHCTTVHSLVPAWPLFCQPITEELRFTCFALIGPLSVLRTLIAACWHSPYALHNGLCKTIRQCYWCHKFFSCKSMFATQKPNRKQTKPKQTQFVKPKDERHCWQH